ncbi:hypothetical protein H6758_02320 [Candidatus Nomurabacteria bacterium]|nr:hypothetical protein [Candidatus Nomurabacteria bacterium]
MQKSKNKNKKTKYRPTHEDDGYLYEMILDPNDGKTYFVGLVDGEVKIREEFGDTKPFPATHDLIAYGAIMLPSEATKYGSQAELITEIQTFIHKYLEVSPFYEKIATYYVLFTWMYDKFNELPYLRAIADFGNGKSRFLKTIGSLCYRPMVTMGASTVAPIFRILHQFHGTLILDEADIRYSDTNNEIVKILNVGFQRGQPVFRCSAAEYDDVQAFEVFGPKLVATREKYQDQALESRFLVEKMDGSLTRSDVPINLGDSFGKEALAIRNRCLYWRLENYSKEFQPYRIEDKSIEPRLRQIAAPLCGIIEDEAMRNELIDFIRTYNNELRDDRGMTDEGEILEVMIGLAKEDSGDISINSITSTYNLRLTTRNQKSEVSNKKVGYIVRHSFNMQNKRANHGYVVVRESFDREIKKLLVKYNFEDELVNLVNVTGEAEPFVKEMRELGVE